MGKIVEVNTQGPKTLPETIKVFETPQHLGFIMHCTRTGKYRTSVGLKTLSPGEEVAAVLADGDILIHTSPHHRFSIPDTLLQQLRTRVSSFLEENNVTKNNTVGTVMGAREKYQLQYSQTFTHLQSLYKTDRENEPYKRNTPLSPRTVAVLGETLVSARWFVETLDRQNPYDRLEIGKMLVSINQFFDCTNAHKHQDIVRQKLQLHGAIQLFQSGRPRTITHY